MDDVHIRPIRTSVVSTSLDETTDYEQDRSLSVIEKTTLCFKNWYSIISDTDRVTLHPESDILDYKNECVFGQCLFWNNIRFVMTSGYILMI